MQLPNNLSTPLAFLAKLPQQKVAHYVSILLLMYIAYVLAGITWQIAEPAQAHVYVGKSAQTTNDGSSTSAIDVSQLKSLHLFGQYIAKQTQKKAKQVSQEIKDAPQTRLNLKLSGVVASKDKQIATAVIENSGSQNTYGIGDKIEKTRAVLEEVLFDRVIIKHAGQLETLMLDGIKFNKNVSESASRQRPKAKNTQQRSNRNSKVVDNRNNEALKERVGGIKSALENDPGKISDYLRISPKMKNGDIVGYLLMPGKDPEFFKSSGLKSGDVAVQMNGYDLTSAVDAAQALQALKTETEVALWVDRNGDVTEILFSIEN